MAGGHVLARIDESTALIIDFGSGTLTKENIFNRRAAGTDVSEVKFIDAREGSDPRQIGLAFRTTKDGARKVIGIIVVRIWNTAFMF